jgi:hypothetical protein
MSCCSPQRRPTPPEEALGRLVAAGLAFQRGIAPAAKQLEHALVQDTANGSLPPTTSWPMRSEAQRMRASFMVSLMTNHLAERKLYKPCVDRRGEVAVRSLLHTLRGTRSTNTAPPRKPRQRPSPARSSDALGWVRRRLVERPPAHLLFSFLEPCV